MQKLFGKTCAFVFARGGSKGLPGKNILPIGGHPLIAHSIRLAQSIEAIDSVYVSTDCPQIALAAKQYGAELIKRPDEMATDTSLEWLSWQHGINHVLTHHGYFYGVTSELRL